MWTFRMGRLWSHWCRSTRLGRICLPANPSFRSSLFQKAGGFQRQRLWSPSAEGEISQMIPKDQEGKARQPGGLSGRGEPYQGVPRRTQSCTSRLQTITAPARRNGKRFDSLARFFALDNLEVRHAAIFSKLQPRGHPRAACGPPFPIFGLRPRRNGVGISVSAESDQRRCLWNLPAF